MQINYVEKSINCKIVYYGPGESGKTTNLQTLCEIEPHKTGRLITLNTESEKTVFFDYLQVQESIRGFRVKVTFYTVPGQQIHHATRKLVLSGADAVVFVADSDSSKSEANKYALNELGEFLKGHNLNIKAIPYVLQLNKRDLSSAENSDLLTSKLKFKDDPVPVIEAIATESKGVLETKEAILSELITDIRENRLS